MLLAGLTLTNERMNRGNTLVCLYCIPVRLALDMYFLYMFLESKLSGNLRAPLASCRCESCCLLVLRWAGLRFVFAKSGAECVGLSFLCT